MRRTCFFCDHRILFRRYLTPGSLLLTCLAIAGLTVASTSAEDASFGKQYDATKALHELFDAEWQRTLRENPTQASRLGDRRYNRLWDDVSEAAIQTSATMTRQALNTLLKIDAAQLSRADRLNYQLFKR